MYETRTVTAEDLPGWACGLEANAPDLATIEGGADYGTYPVDEATGSITTPRAVRGSSVPSITTPAWSSPVAVCYSPFDGPFAPDGSLKVLDSHIHTSDSIANTSATLNSSSDANAPTSRDADSIINTDAATTGASAVIIAPAAVSPDSSPIREISGLRSPINTRVHGPGLFETMGWKKPVFDKNIDPSRRRQATIDLFFAHMEQSDCAAAAIAASESPVKGDFSPFTPNTARYFAECEDSFDQAMALPSLTPLFKAASRSTLCELSAIASVAQSTSTAAGSGTVSAPVASSSKVSASAPVRSIGSSRKRSVREIVDEADDEVEFISFISTTGKGKAKAKGKGPGKPKGLSASKKPKSPSASKKQKGN